MFYRFCADALVVFHVSFVAFVLFGGLAVAWRPWLAALHLPAVAWGALVELNSWLCPLTPWELALRARAGQAGYSGGFVEHYLLPALYPARLTPSIQIVMGCVVIIVNVVVYAAVLSRWAGVRRKNSSS